MTPPKTGEKVVLNYGTEPRWQVYGILSPILSNIVLHEFDKFMAKLSESFHKGKKRKKMEPALQKFTSQKGEN